MLPIHCASRALLQAQVQQAAHSPNRWDQFASLQPRVRARPNQERMACQQREAKSHRGQPAGQADLKPCHWNEVAQMLPIRRGQQAPVLVPVSECVQEAVHFPNR